MCVCVCMCVCVAMYATAEYTLSDVMHSLYTCFAYVSLCHICCVAGTVHPSAVAAWIAHKVIPELGFTKSALAAVSTVFLFVPFPA
jgi:hypothetical protein